ncbi:polysaccharide pyruvyl transferase family protein [Ureibacillus chungkukjangi]|uniref:polysaccharide pyruvyl transferase family protein n=1 Tax=Ureibacillus chungkukjangi TaxID=1202712 RepID=UPI0020406068|nr:polysaccharide pyruvyl transferase family protein [Ureibacillus chungkukjangi]MCM3389120.1 polysaccharide pyruvyl transferase family protein [Ureibacillus chungkukjangi]
MKIGIVGNYGNDNNGDESILVGILSQLKSQFSVKDEDITVFSNNTQQTSERYGVQSYPLYYKQENLYKTFYKTYRTNQKYVSKFDLLIIGGGGILMDFYRREAHLYSTYALMAKNSKVPYVVYGCGAGPLDTFTGRFMIRLMCKNAENISVRDPESKQLLKKIGVKKDITVIGDPAFSLHKPKEVQVEKPVNIGVSAVPIYNANYWPSGDVEKYEAYVESMASNLDHTIENQNVNITFFATKYPQDVYVTKDIQKKMRHKEKVKIIDANLHPERLLEVTSSFDIVIGTRLHSLILATNTQTPIIALSYHQKVSNYMKLINAQNRCISIEEIQQNPNVIAEAVAHIQSNWEEIIEETKDISERLYSEAMSGKQLMVKAVKGK